jgi:hypothetical protein
VPDTIVMYLLIYVIVLKHVKKKNTLDLQTSLRNTNLIFRVKKNILVFVIFHHVCGAGVKARSLHLLGNHYTIGYHPHSHFL